MSVTTESVSRKFFDLTCYEIKVSLKVEINRCRYAGELDLACSFDVHHTYTMRCQFDLDDRVYRAAALSIETVIPRMILEEKK